MTNMNVLSKLSMTSLEIAELVGSRHDSVKRAIERLSDKSVIQLPPMVEREKINGLGLKNTYSHYVFSGEQGKRDSIVVVAQLSPEFTARLVDRWQELESKNLIQLPNFNDPGEAARAWAEIYDEKKKLAIEHQATKVENAHLKSHFTDGMTLVNFARTLNGVNTMQLQNCLESKGWIRRDKKSGWRVNAQYRDRYLAERTSIFKNPNTEEEQERHYPILLRAGAVKLFKMYSEGLLPMKANWNGSIGHGDEVLR